jgi:hypothetical protein
MINLVRTVMSLACFAAAGGIVLSHQRPAPAGTVEPPTWTAGADRLDHLLGELGVGEAIAPPVQRPTVITNEHVEALRAEAALSHDPMSVSGPVQPVTKAAGRTTRVRRDAPAPSRGHSRLVGGSSRPQTLWQRSRWRDHVKAQKLERRLRGKTLGSRSRIAKYRETPSVKFFGEQNPKTPFERTRHYRKTGSKTANLRKKLNQALRR